ncbi:NAD(P)H-hydrate dehydratase [Candidatus Micrarchaeota archaeon]|nr:NAD(P)H-hydrate dehydratase [Candidatus Micrarchaeota archaeon]
MISSQLISRSILKELHTYKADSHKGQNGVMTVIGGSKTYHGAPLLAMKAASRFVDLVYFHSIERDNAELIRFLKPRLCAFIAVDERKLPEAIKRSECVLIGNGVLTTGECRSRLHALLKSYPRTRMVLDAGALRMVKLQELRNNMILTPNTNEFYSLFGVPPSPLHVIQKAREYDCTIVLKGTYDLVSDGKQLFRNVTGNVGMTKGGTGDSLSGLAAAFFCHNQAFLAAKAACYLNGYAGDLLKKKMDIAYNADDLVDAIPFAFRKALKG